MGFCRRQPLYVTPGITLSDDGGLSGTIQFDPHRAEEYEVNFIAVSTNNWQDEAIGIIRYEVSFKVVDNIPPESYPLEEFEQKQSAARQEAGLLLKSLNRVWSMWEHGNSTIVRLAIKCVQIWTC